MKNLILSATVLCSIAIIGCNKQSKTDEGNSDDGISNETATFTLRESGFSIIESEPLSEIKNDIYTSGVLEYTKSGEVLATFDYAADAEDESGEVTIEGKKKKCGLGHKKDWDGKGKDKKDYFKKVVVQPIVKADDCDYIVSGIIKYYNLKTGDYTATVDFGDGTCDDIATKTTADGTVYQFTISQYYK